VKQKATLALFLVTIIWGWTFIWLKNALNVAESYSSDDQVNTVAILFVTLRFGFSILLFFIFTPKVIGVLGDKQVWKDGFILSLFMVGGFVFQMIGLDGISPAVSAFLTSLYVIFTALILAWFSGKLQSRNLLFGVFLATIGAGYIQGPPQLHYDIAEWLTILCALMFGGHIIFTDISTKRVSPIGLGFTSILISTIICLLLFNIFLFSEIGEVDIIGLLRDIDFLLPLLLSSIFGTFAALVLVNTYQKYLNPVRAAILYGLEPVWATLFSIYLDMTEFTFWLILGGSLLLIGNLIAELGNQSVSE
jgi:drug/metabolite transporter (DMT)-like permease|tara:strand:+ start:3637 stop:4554 length:918 start_codon:yes stop_codon:yes gene_type:complete